MVICSPETGNELDEAQTWRTNSENSGWEVVELGRGYMVLGIGHVRNPDLLMDNGQRMRVQLLHGGVSQVLCRPVTSTRVWFNQGVELTC